MYIDNNSAYNNGAGVYISHTKNFLVKNMLIK